MIRDFHTLGKLVRGLNSSFITLIPKISSPQRIVDFRPISLIGNAYKIVVKVLAERLSKVIDSIIADNQTTFIKVCQIMDIILIFNKALDEAKKLKLLRIFFKVDFTKAFDSVSWCYIDRIMENFGFNER